MRGTVVVERQLEYITGIPPMRGDIMSQPVHLIQPQLLEYLEKSTPDEREQLIAQLKIHGWNVSLQKCDPFTGLRWVKSRLLLKQGTKILLRLRENAKNQIAILDAFEKKKWQTTIRNDADYAKELIGQRMHDTLNRLNKYQSIIKFKYSGKRRDPKEEHVRFRLRHK